MRRSLRLYIVVSTVVCLTNIATATEEVYFRASPGKKVTLGGGGNGTSYRKAILVHAPSGSNPVGAEYEYVVSHFRGCKIVKHQREFYTSRTYDIITFTSADGATRALFFQIAVEQ